MPRILITETPKHVGETVDIAGWVSIRRDHGKLVFLDVRDRSGHVQLIVAPDHGEAMDVAHRIKTESTVRVTGLVKERPGKVKEGEGETARVEIEVEKLEILSEPGEDLVVDVSQGEMNLNLDTLLNNRTLALRNEKVQAIFKVYSEMLSAYERVMRERGFLEIKTPKILSSATEGGANFFKIKYFDREAYLAQSPQFYKQAAMSAFERVFEVGPVFRAEPHFTARHVNEFTGLDAEMGFIESFEDVMAELELVMMSIVRELREKCSKEFALHGAALPNEVAIPRIRLSEALEILKKEYKKEIEDEDIDGEGEQLICDYVKKKYDSDFVFLTHYPTRLRAFYSRPTPDHSESSETYDLLFRGVEIASGGERISDYALLKTTIEKRGLKPEDFKDYLEIFKYGTPRHGGWGLGGDRIVQKLLGLASVKEAILYPRDVKRLTP